ncbi:hypothetical protein [Aureimonas phyllosphaerae]|uniref:TniQ protein n=1 Tax=Aureimonas phyllosphaerae TaxID=1166078 RepID=A0A7W6BSJ3_9HYPH|nr:hypothetical protein [Aureimonas phyllosphaerae]MBB3937236.1 hypothetical protein [Aureimonas phyllosphaerae]MBB3961127.1 hypothetical protein [Aureimonas phyllosphaerae]SFF49244.1 hypothetical protein SAMN05216566_11764 [Aureimonas phyllosphaerae]
MSPDPFRAATALPLASIRPFSWTASPHPGESLMGYVTRVMSVNVYPNTALALSLAGIETRYAGAVVSLSPDALAAVARLVGTTREILHALAGGAHGCGGDPSVVRRALSLVQVRRVSSLTLRREPWHHAIWDSRLLSFCPKSLEPLRDRCPVCDRRLDYRRSLGPTKCQLCVDETGLPTVDLRDYPLHVFPDVDEEAVGWAVDLLFAGPRADEAMSRLPQSLASMARARILDVLHFLLRVRREHAAQEGVRAPTAGSDIGFTPDEVAVGFRSLLRWPDSVDALVDEVRAVRSTRPGSFGRGKEIGGLDVMLGSVTTLPAEIRRVVREAADASFARSDEVAEGLVRRVEYRSDVDLVPRRQASREFVVGDRLLQRLVDDRTVFSMRADAHKSPILLKRSELAGIVAGREKAIALRVVVGILGILEPEVRGLVEDGRLPPFDDPSRRLLRQGATYVSREDLHRLVRDVEAATTLPRQEGERSRRLSLVVREAVGGLADWGAIFAAIAEGRIEVMRRDEAGSSLVGRLQIATGQVTALQAIARPLRNHRGKLDLQGVRAALGVSNALANLVVSSGLLGERGQIDLEGVARFRQLYASAREIVAGSPVAFHTLRPALEAAGIGPVHVLGPDPTGAMHHLYLRCEIEPWMGRFQMIGAIGGDKRGKSRRRRYLDLGERE